MTLVYLRKDGTFNLYQVVITNGEFSLGPVTYIHKTSIKKKRSAYRVVLSYGKQPEPEPVGYRKFLPSVTSVIFGGDHLKVNSIQLP